MRIASTIARYLAGLIFLVMGLNGFLNFIHFPPPTGTAAQFMGALYVSHYLWVIFAFQVVGGAPVLVNIIVFHITMAPAGLPLALFVALLWAVIFFDVRPAFSGLFQARVQPQA